jgi:hypothetical protein
MMELPKIVRIDSGHLIVRTADLVLENVDPVVINTVKHVVKVNRFKVERAGRSKVTNITQTVNLARCYRKEFDDAINQYIKKVYKLKRAAHWKHIYHS